MLKSHFNKVVFCAKTQTKPQPQHCHITKQMSNDGPADGNASEGQWQLILSLNLEDLLKNLSGNRIGRQHTVFCLSSCHSKGQVILFFSSSLHLPHKQSSRQIQSHIALFTAVQYSIFFLAPSVPCSHPLCTTGWSTCAPHSLPATPTVSHFCPLTV